LTFELREPPLEEIEQAIIRHLIEVESGALSTLAEDGFPHTCGMHMASDGFSVYLHTYKYTRKFAHILRDPRCSFMLAYEPPGGFADRAQARNLQIRGRATVVEDEEEIEHAVEVSRQQFDWLKEISLYENFRRPSPRMKQVFFRVDPISGSWQDNRVRMTWAQLVEFEDGRLVSCRPYAKNETNLLTVTEKSADV
jgi:general stress protein 26